MGVFSSQFLVDRSKCIELKKKQFKLFWDIVFLGEIVSSPEYNGSAQVVDNLVRVGICNRTMDECN